MLVCLQLLSFKFFEISVFKDSSRSPHGANAKSELQHEITLYVRAAAYTQHKQSKHI
jgi:hypothetical protein